MVVRSKFRDKSVALEDDPYLRLLVYGQSGCGKTGLCDEPTLFISPDPYGPATVKLLHGENGSRRWPVVGWDDIDECHAYWYNRLVVKGEECPFRWFALDTLTEVQDESMDAILEAAVEKNSDRDPYIPSLQDYGKNQLMILRLVKSFNQLPVNILYTAWDLQYSDSNGQETTIPDIRGGAKKGHTVSKEVCGKMTSFGHMSLKTVAVKGQSEKKEVRRIIWKNRRTEADGLITGKDRTGVLAPHTDDITLSEIRKRREAKLAEASSGKTSATPRRTTRRRATA